MATCSSPVTGPSRSLATRPPRHVDQPGRPRPGPADHPELVGPVRRSRPQPAGQEHGLAPGPRDHHRGQARPTRPGRDPPSVGRGQHGRNQVGGPRRPVRPAQHPEVDRRHRDDRHQQHRRRDEQRPQPRPGDGPAVPRSAPPADPPGDRRHLPGGQCLVPTRSQRPGGGAVATAAPSRAVVSPSSHTSSAQARQVSRCRSKPTRSVSDSAWTAYAPVRSCGPALIGPPPDGPGAGSARRAAAS